MASDGLTSIDYWPGVEDEPSVNELTDLSSRVAYENVLDIENRLSVMRQGISPSVFCGAIFFNNDSRVSASAYSDKATGGSCNTSQIDTTDSRCCLTERHTLDEMTYLVQGGFYPPPSDTKWGVFDGYIYSAPPAALCEAGMEFNATSHSCFSCSPGSATHTSERFVCKLCERGKYAPGSGMAQCLECEQGTYSDHRGSAICKRCPTGATCDTSSLTVNPGMWRESFDSFDIHECPFGVRACLGGNTTAHSCAPGHGGVLCAVCGPGHVQAGGRCMDCNAFHTPVSALVLAVAAAVVGLAVWYLRSTSESFAAALESISFSVPCKIYFATCQVTWQVHKGAYVCVLRFEHV